MPSPPPPWWDQPGTVLLAPVPNSKSPLTISRRSHAGAERLWVTAPAVRLRAVSSAALGVPFAFARVVLAKGLVPT